MTVRAIEWDPATDRLRLLDQTKLPGESVHLDIKSVDALVDAIAILAVRGAPALGVAGAMGVVTALDEGAERGWSADEVLEAVDRIAAARPTAVNLAWGVDQVRGLIDQGRDAVLEAARRVAVEDEAANRELSRLGADWLLARVCGCSPIATPARSQPQGGARPWGWCANWPTATAWSSCMPMRRGPCCRGRA